MITILSLLEGRDDNYVISRLIRAFNIEIFKENLMSIYECHIRLYQKPVYDYEVFNHYVDNSKYQFGKSDNKQDLNPDFYRVIIEVGFMIYHLMKYFQDNDDPENREIIDEELPKNELDEEDNDFIGAKLLGGIGKFGVALLKDTVSSVAKLAKIGTVGNIDNSNLIEDAYEFFDKHTGNVEIIFNGKIRKVYFSLPPDYTGLNEDIKENFLRNADRTSDQTKLRYLAVKTKEITEQMRHEHKIQKIINQYPIVNTLASNI